MSRSIQNHVMVLRFTQNKSQNLFSRLQITHHPPFLFPYSSPPHSLSSSHTGFQTARHTPARAHAPVLPSVHHAPSQLSAGLTPHLPVFLRCHLCNETDLDHTKAFESHHPWTLQILLSFFFFASKALISTYCTV